MLDGSFITERFSVTHVQQYLNKGYHLFIVIYYISISQAKYFIEIGTSVIGNIRVNMKTFLGSLGGSFWTKQELYFISMMIESLPSTRASKTAPGEAKVDYVSISAY